MTGCVLQYGIDFLTGVDRIVLECRLKVLFKCHTGVDRFCPVDKGVDNFCGADATVDNLWISPGLVGAYQLRSQQPASTSTPSKFEHVYIILSFGCPVNR
jgi:hypothetical protein